jgi:hypothetical protein
MNGPTSFGSDDAGESADSETAGRRRGRLAGARRRVGGLFAPRAFLLALALVSAGLLVGGSVPLLGAVGRLVGVAVGAFALGLVGARRRYLEVAVAGGLAAGLAFVLGVLTSALFPIGVSVLQDYGVTLAGVGAGSGALAALVGHYLGRDLRAGLTHDL